MNKLKLCSKSKILPAFIAGDCYIYHRSCHDRNMIVAIKDKLYLVRYNDAELYKEDQWMFDTPIAYIDRENKIISISTLNVYIINNISKHVAGYKVYLSNTIDAVRINDNIVNLTLATIKWFIHQIYNVQYENEFKVIAGRQQVYYGSRDKFNDPIDVLNPLNNVNYLRAFRKWLEFNKLTNSNTFNIQPAVYTIIGSRRVDIRNVGAIYKYGIFTKAEEEVLRRRYFYSTRIRGKNNVEHISFAAMNAEWELPFVVDRNFTNGAKDILSLKLPIDDWNSQTPTVSVKANYIRYLLSSAEQVKEKCFDRIKELCKSNPIEVFRNKEYYINQSKYQYFRFYTDIEKNTIECNIVKCYFTFDVELFDKYNILVAMYNNGDIYTNTRMFIKHNTAKYIYKRFIAAKTNKEGTSEIDIEGSIYSFQLLHDEHKLVIGCSTISEKVIEDFIDYYKLNDWRE